jgi:hypothetical protein
VLQGKYSVLVQFLVGMTLCKDFQLDFGAIFAGWSSFSQARIAENALTKVASGPQGLPGIS